MSCCLNACCGTATAVKEKFSGFDWHYITMIEFQTEKEIKTWQRWAAKNLTIPQKGVGEMVNMEVNTKYLLLTYTHRGKERWESLYTLDKYIKHLASENEGCKNRITYEDEKIRLNRELIQIVLSLA